MDHKKVKIPANDAEIISRGRDNKVPRCPEDVPQLISPVCFRIALPPPQGDQIIIWGPLVSCWRESESVSLWYKSRPLKIAVRSPLEATKGTRVESCFLLRVVHSGGLATHLPGIRAGT